MADSIKNSILAKFQQFSKDKEEASAKQEDTPIQGGNRGFKGKRPFKNQRTNRGPLVSLAEKDVGITEYLSPAVGFSGIIKHRFSDFQVHEIDKDGKLVVLDSTTIPESTAEAEPDTEYRNNLTEEQWSELERIVNSEGDDRLSIDVTDKDKEYRSAIHKAVKRAYGAKVCSNSVKEDDKTFIKVGRVTKKDKERNSWPSDQGRFLHFTAFKENLDTGSLASILSKQLRTRTSLISFAGNKDKRAKTTQRMCVKNKRAEHVKSAKVFRAHFGNYSYKHSALRLGDLFGNKFSLAIRDVDKSDEEIDKCLSSVKSLGFINYYGLQRFGTSATMPTHWVGKLMLLEDWKGAVDAILMPKNNVHPDVQEACETWAKTKNPVLALKSLGKRIPSSIEGKILNALKKHPNNFYDALFAIPRNSLLLYLHAYQSYVWNTVVSRRIREYGLKTLPGDLVIVQELEETNGASKDAAEIDGTPQDDKNETEKDEGAESDSDDDSEKDEESPGAKKNVCLEKVRKLSEEEAAVTDLSEVVYPTPGNDIEFPGNCIEKWYFEAMEEDGITMENFTNSKKVFAMYGAYRKVLAKAQDMTWKIVKYDDAEADLILSDLDKMNGRTLDLADNDNAKYKAVVMDFNLESSTYATMLIREVTKCETSSAYHAKLTREAHQANANDDEPPEKIQKLDKGCA